MNGSAPPSHSRDEAAAAEAKVLGKHQLGEIFSARSAIVWEDETRRVHEQSRGNPERVPGCERRIDCLMTPNHKLTNVIRGRIVEDLQMNPAEVSMIL